MRKSEIEKLLLDRQAQIKNAKKQAVASDDLAVRFRINLKIKGLEAEVRILNSRLSLHN